MQVLPYPVTSTCHMLCFVRTCQGTAVDTGVEAHQKKKNHIFIVNTDSLTLKSSGMRSFDVRRKFKIYLNICPSLSMK